MAEKSGVRFKPTPAGLAVLLLPMILMHRGFGATDAVSTVVGVGLPSLAVLSLLFLLSGIRRIAAAARSAETCSSALPGRCRIGVPVILTVDPSRPKFIPGIRLSVVWTLRFGPFRTVAQAILPASGAGSARLTLNRRGAWRGRTLLRAADPFGFFHLECRCGSIRTVIVPPRVLALDGSDVPGRPEALTATAPRLREDAETRMERRSYIPGDDPRRLDWRHFARSGEMLIRVGEDGLPLLGRLWIQVISPRERFVAWKERLGRLDVALEAASDLVRRFEEDGGDVRLLLPGESAWKGAGEDLDARMARSTPPDHPGDLFPAPGERLWIVSYPSTAAVRTASRGQRHGCRITLGFPADIRLASIPIGWKPLIMTGGELPGPGRRRCFLRSLKKAAGQYNPGGSDVRRI